MYEAWHVKSLERLNGMPMELNYHSVMIYTNCLRPATMPAVRVKISGWRWECPHCSHENENDTSTIPVAKLRCSECSREFNGVLTDADDDILVEGCPFPE